jgi:predicted membrane protein (TIGR00267 family)
MSKTEAAAPGHHELIARLLEFWRDEMEAREVYARLAQREPNAHRRDILTRLSDTEAAHAERWAGRLRELGVEPPAHGSVALSAGWKLSLEHAPVDALLRRMEREERANLEAHSADLGDPDTDALAREIAEEDAQHSGTLQSLLGEVIERRGAAESQLLGILGRERWHRRGSDWVAGAIYGVNDGLGAVFGIVAGVSGATLNSAQGAHAVLLAGLAGTIASAVSMGAGAFLATKSEAEVAQAEVERERQELEEDPDLEREEMVLFYQLKGFSEAESARVTDALLEDRQKFLQEHAQEELHVSGGSAENALRAGIAAMLSTAVGAIVPVLPFFWLTGVTAVIVAAGVSLLAHFAVGAAKSLITVRNWLSSGLEMTLAGVFVGVVTYGVGTIFQPLLSHFLGL